MPRLSTLILLLTLAVLSVFARPTSDPIAQRQATRSNVIKRLQQPHRRAEPSTLPAPAGILFRLRVPTDSALVALRGMYFTGSGAGARATANSATAAGATIYRLKTGSGLFQAESEPTYSAIAASSPTTNSAVPFFDSTSEATTFISCSIVGNAFRCADPGMGTRAFGVLSGGQLSFIFGATPTVYPVIAELA